MGTSPFVGKLDGKRKLSVGHPKPQIQFGFYTRLTKYARPHPDNIQSTRKRLSLINQQLQSLDAFSGIHQVNGDCYFFRRQRIHVQFVWGHLKRRFFVQLQMTIDISPSNCRETEARALTNTVSILAGIGDWFTTVISFVSVVSKTTCPKNSFSGSTETTGPWPMHFISQYFIDPTPKMFKLK